MGKATPPQDMLYAISIATNFLTRGEFETAIEVRG
ncbi:hypothetical protein RB2150_01254 [Rhodobacteraceae bacterium HTCC2150]|nr:hypothetical protein RB2150_01254 [Rhodobacteraceae bacterium HTCC2150]